jgi:peptide/nickel transport system permease protein
LIDTLSRYRPKPCIPKNLPCGVILSSVFLTALLLAALFPQCFISTDPLSIHPESAFQSPSFVHWFGTDQSGRDIFTRVIHGSRQSLSIGMLAIALAFSIAVPLGLVAGFAGGILDHVIGWIIEILFAFPSLILALLFVAMFGSGISQLILATGLSIAPGYARMIRGQVLSIRKAGYIEAARALGHTPWRIISRQLLPNAMRPLLVLITLGVGQAIVWSSALSFLGLGAKPPAPEWGTMMSVGRDFIANAWWLTFFPGFFILMTTLSTTVVGRHMQQRLEGGDHG